MKLYRSEIDTWALVLLAFLPFLPVATAILTHAALAYFAFSAVLLVYVLFVLPTAYRLGEKELEIRYGLMRSRIPYSQIHSAVLTRSALAAPALSLDRIAITYGEAKQQQISPQNRTAFLADLATRVPGLRASIAPSNR